MTIMEDVLDLVLGLWLAALGFYNLAQQPLQMYQFVTGITLAGLGLVVIGEHTIQGEKNELEKRWKKNRRNNKKKFGG